MRWLTSLRTQPERGATAVMTGLLLVALVGFVGLAVDGGAAYAKHQELQNGADAAALAAAQECAEDEANCKDLHLQAEAGPYGEANVRTEKDTVVSQPFQVDLSERTVVATISGDLEHWFMPVLGISESELSADAEATWGYPRSGPAFPLAVSRCTFEESLDTDGGIVEIRIPKNRSDKDDRECLYGEDYPPGSFGWLADAEDCEAQVTVDDRADTDTGLADKPDCDWESFIDEVVLIPIFDEDYGQGNSGEVHVWAFAPFRVLGIYIQTGNEQYGEECVIPRDSTYEHKTCLRGEFVDDYVTSADGYEPGGPDAGVSVVSLID